MKPENIGFDSQGNVKLFDFGLAKCLHPSLMLESSDDASTLYRLTARTGTFPYMAPEVARKLPYNETCDVFGFAILLWEMLSLECAFSDIQSRREFYYRLSIVGERPTVPASWPPRTKELLPQAWAIDCTQRPSFSQVADVLKADMLDLSTATVSQPAKPMAEESARGVVDF